MAATTKLIVFNAALREIGAAPIANLVTANSSLAELNGSFDHAVEYVLAQRDWNFARRRATLTGIADVSVQPFTYRYSRPTDYLRKCWVKLAASDAFQIDHTEVASALYGYETTAQIEYISDHADVYDPANWPPQFTRCIALYLALLIAPRISRSPEDSARLWGALSDAVEAAENAEAVFATNVEIPTEYMSTMRVAIGVMGQQIGGSVQYNAHVDWMRWQMYVHWAHAVRYCLELAAWNFAAKRALFNGGLDADSMIPADTTSGIVEGYSVGPVTDSEDTISVSGYDYAYPIPDDFLHKVWLKPTATSDLEINYQRLGGYFVTNYDPCVMEYIAENDDTTNPDAWPETFRRVVAHYLALLVAPEFVIEKGPKSSRVNANVVRDRLQAQFKAALSEARAKDAIQQYSIVVPVGSYVRARLGRRMY